MKRLTPDEEVQEVADIANEDGWPLWPVLPMKNLYEDGEHLGLMFSGRRTIVYLMNLFDLRPGITYLDNLKGKPFVEFESTEALVKAGWVGD